MFTWRINLSSAIFALAFLTPFFASADVLYNQLDDNSSATSTPGATGVYTMSDTSFVAPSGACAISPFGGLHFFLKSTGGGTNGFSVGIASSTQAYNDFTWVSVFNSLPYDGAWHEYNITDLQPNYSYSGCLDAGVTYSLRISVNGANPVQIMSDPLFRIYGSIVSGGSPFPTPSTVTRIITTTPTSGSTVATSTSFSFGATGYVNDADYSSGMYLEIKYLLQSSGQAAVGNVDLLAQTLDLPISASGSFSVSTTTSILRAGVYTVNTSIRQPSLANTALNFLGFGQFATFGIRSATTTSFTAGHRTAFDVFIASTTQAMNDYVASSTVSLSSCTSWTGFNLIDCLNLLFFPQYQPIADALNNFKNGFLSYFPWGYVTRLIVIFSGNTGANLPAFSVPVPISASETIYVNYDEQDMLTGGAAVLDDACSSTQLGIPCRDVVEPYLIEFLAVCVVFIIARDLWGIAHTGSHTRATKLS